MYKKKFIQAVGCFLEFQEEFVLLKRTKQKSDPLKWGIPAGKVNPYETNQQAIIREVLEETGYSIEEKELEFVVNFVHEDLDYLVQFPTYRVCLTEKISIKINPGEHIDYAWFPAKKCYFDMKESELMPGLKNLLICSGYIEK